MVTSTLPPRRVQPTRRQLALILVVVLVLAGVGGALWYRLRPGWQLSWSDEFYGSRLDPARWQVENNSTFGDGNKELACLMNRPANVQVAGGQLSLTARRENCTLVCGDWTSGFRPAATTARR